MARFDLLDEYTSVVVPGRAQSGVNSEMTLREASPESRYGKSSWRGAMAMIALLDFIGRRRLPDPQQRKVHLF
jgi:hypothetical protein